MKKDLLHTPEGVRDIYSTECAEKKVMENRLHDVCTLYGYNDIQTPTMEFFDVFNKERGSVSSTEMFKLFDRYNNTLVLRPDMTPSIARAAAKYFEDHILPLKLCYVGNTFINVSKYYQGRLKENTMIGAELIDDDSIEADYEIISMLIECMKNAGLKEFQVEIGNVAFFNGLLNEAGIKGEAAEELLTLIKDKNYFGVEELLESLKIDKNISQILLELPQMFGSVDVLDKARSLTSNRTCIEAIDRLLKLYDLLKLTGDDRYISFDLGALSSHEYYTGIIFHAHTFGTGEPVASGGRYDKLLGQFGCDKASIGFSITVDRLLTAIKRQNIVIPIDYSGYLIVYSEDTYSDALNKAVSLRKAGINTCLIRYNENKTNAQYLEYAKACQLDTCIIIGTDYLTDKTVTKMSIKEPGEVKVSFDSIMCY
ncbi:MAG: ATP phosphoribosyltransferase regulatory subunit [Lachnospira sp.]